MATRGKAGLAVDPPARTNARAGRLTGGGTAGNERLTNVVGSADLSSDVTGRAGRMMALGGALVAGVVLAILVIPEFGPWLHNLGVFQHHR